MADIYPAAPRRRCATRCCRRADGAGGDAVVAAAARRQRRARPAAHRQSADRPALRRARLHRQGAGAHGASARRHRDACRRCRGTLERDAAADRRDRREGQQDAVRRDRQATCARRLRRRERGDRSAARPRRRRRWPRCRRRWRGPRPRSTASTATSPTRARRCSRTSQETLLELQRTARVAARARRLPAAASRIDPARQAGRPADARQPLSAAMHADIPLAHRRSPLAALPAPRRAARRSAAADPTAHADAGRADAARLGAPARGPVFVSLEPIRLPAQVDQPQWLVRLPDESLAQPRAGALGQPAARRAAAGAARAADRAIRRGRGATRRRRAARRCAVALELRRFDSVPGREARIEGSWTLAGGVAQRCAAACSSASRPGRHGRARRGTSSRRGATRRRHRRQPACAVPPARRACLPDGRAALNSDRPAVLRRSGGVAAEQRQPATRLEPGQGRTTISFLTLFTPLTFMAMLSAVLFSVAFFAKPDSITLPFSVSTLMADGVDVLVVDHAGLHRGA